MKKKVGNFLDACKKISSKINTFVNRNNLNTDNVYIFWLEDDWMLKKEERIELDTLIEVYSSNLSCINFSYIRNNYIHALAPCILSYNLWNNIHYKAWMSVDNNIDPEHCVGKFFLENNKQVEKFEDVYNLTIINKFKRVDDKFFNSSMLNNKNSFYTYDLANNTRTIYNKNYINRNFIKKNFINKYTFMRITSASCSIMNDKKYILIGTTATNRSVLHNDVLAEWSTYFNTLDKSKYNIEWFINIDYIESLNENVITTRNNLKSIIKDIKIHFTNSGENIKGNFLNACKNVSSCIENYVINNKLNIDDVIIIWLEDDWKLNIENIPIQEIIENYLSNLTYINLSYIRLNYIHALAPCIINYNLWCKIHLLAWKNQKDHIDPEHCVGLYYLKNFGKFEHLLNITVINKYKKIKENYFKNDMFKLDNSYYTYDVDNNNNNIINKKYIKKNDIKNFIKDKITFIRISTSMCLDGVNYGRDFMKKYNIEKKKMQNNVQIDFYKKID